MSTSFCAVFSGPVKELVPGVLNKDVPFLDVLVEQEQIGGQRIPLTFRLVGPMSEHWGKVLKPGVLVSLAGTICLDGDSQETVYTYFLVNSVIDLTPSV